MVLTHDYRLISDGESPCGRVGCKALLSLEDHHMERGNL